MVSLSSAHTSNAHHHHRSNLSTSSMPSESSASSHQTFDAAASVRYLCSVASELNDVGAELHASLLDRSESENDDSAGGASRRSSLDADAYDAGLSLYKEGVSAVMEAVDGGLAAPGGALTLEDMNRAGSRRMEMIVRAREMLLSLSSAPDGGSSSDAENKTGNRRRSFRRKLGECMFSPPSSACDSGTLLMTAPVKSPKDSTCMAYLNPSQQANDLGCVTLCNIGLLQLHKSALLRRGGKSENDDCDESLESEAFLEGAVKFFRMAVAAGEGAANQDLVSCGSAEVDRARVQSMNNLGHALYRQGRYEDAVGCFRGAEAIVQARREWIESRDQPTRERRESEWDLPDARIVLLCNVARAHYAACDAHSSSRACQDALELCLAREDASAKSSGNDSNKRGRDKDRRSGDSAAVASSLLYNLALVHEEMGMPDRALALYRKFIDAAPASGCSEDESASGVVAAMTRVLLLERHQVSAKSKNSSSSSSEHSSRSMEDVAGVLRHLRDLRDEYGPDHPSLASVLRCAGSALSEREEFKSALPFLLESLRMEKEAFRSAAAKAEAAAASSAGEHQVDLSADVIVALNAAGECHHGLERLDRAGECYARAREIRRAHLDGMLRCAARNQRAYDAARRQQSQAAAPPRSPASVRFIAAVTMYNGGRVQFELGKREAADGYFAEALELVDGMMDSQRSSLSSCSVTSPALLPECGSLYHNIGQYKLELGRTSDALRCFQGALTARRATYQRTGGEAPRSAVAETLYQLGGLYHRMGDSARALRAFEENLSIEKSMNGGEATNPSSVLTLYNIAQVHYSSCELERSLLLFRRVLSAIAAPGSDVSAYSDTNPALTSGNLRGWIGTVLGEMGLADEARVQLDLSVREGQPPSPSAALSAGGSSSTSAAAGGAPGNGNGVDAASFVRAFAELADWRPAAAA